MTSGLKVKDLVQGSKKRSWMKKEPYSHWKGYFNLFSGFCCQTKSSSFCYCNRIPKIHYGSTKIGIRFNISLVQTVIQATEKPTKELMNQKPVGRTEPLITNVMWRNLLFQAFYQISVLLILQFSGESIPSINKRVNDTLIFNTFVLCQVFNEFNARKLEKKNVFEGIHKNKFLGIVGITLILQVVMVEFLKKFADTERLNWGQRGLCIGMAVAPWPIGWLVKCIPVTERSLF